ncbi:hypothetical protein P7K49_040385, partial [Saguinus oedipus]
LGGSLLTICLSRLCPAFMGSTLLPWALPCGRVSLLWQVASAMAGCICNGIVH